MVLPTLHRTLVRRDHAKWERQQLACLDGADTSGQHHKPRKIVKWAAWRGLFLDQIRNETGVTVLHNAMVKAEADSVKWLIHTYPKLLTAEDEARDTPIVTALKECAQTLLAIERDGLDTDKEWQRAKFFEILASEQIQSTRVVWNVHHFKALQDIAVELLGEVIDLPLRCHLCVAERGDGHLGRLSGARLGLVQGGLGLLELLPGVLQLALQ